MPASVWVLNLIVFGVMLEADLGRRKISRFRVLRPLVTTILIIPLVLTSVPSDSRDLALQAVGVVVGVLLGLASHLFVAVSYGPVKTRKGIRERALSRAGFGYAAFWAVIFGGRLLFIYGTIHWFSRSLGQFLVTHQLSGAGLTDAIVFMALAMALARSVLLGARGRTATRQFAAGAMPAAANGIR